jgi:hypothetical protein
VSIGKVWLQSPRDLSRETLSGVICPCEPLPFAGCRFPLEAPILKTSFDPHILTPYLTSQKITNVKKRLNLVCNWGASSVSTINTFLRFFLWSSPTMKFVTTAFHLAVLSLLAPLPITATSFGVSFGASFEAQTPIQGKNDSLPVKGNNPLTYCADPASNILEIKSVDLTPNPPQP